MKSVERVERLPELGCGVKSFRFDILIRKRLAAPFPDTKDLQSGESAIGAKGALPPMDGTGDMALGRKWRRRVWVFTPCRIFFALSAVNKNIMVIYLS